MVCASPRMPVNTGEPVALDTYEMDRIRYCATQLSRMRSFCREDVEDIAGELLVEVYRALPRFDPSKASRHTFVCRVITMRRKSLIRDARRRFRDAVPLDGPTLIDVAHDERHRKIGYSPINPITTAERAEAVGRALEDLPVRLREIAVLLMSHTQADVARILGVSETSIDRARKQIAIRFDEVGRDELL